MTVLADDLSLPEPEILSEAEWLELTQSELVDALNAYGIEQFKAHYADNTDRNTLFSSFSVGWNLLIQANLAQGEAREHLLSQLALKDHDLARINRLAGLLRREVYRNGIERIYNPKLDDYIEHKVLQADPVHGLWLSPDTEISAATVETLHQNYGVRIVKADFQQQPAAVAEALNTWIQTRTRNEMPGQWEPAQVAQQKNLLWSTFYFQGLWERAFPRQSVEDPTPLIQPFQLPSGEAVEVPILSAYSPLLFYRSNSTSGTSILDMRYARVHKHHLQYNLDLKWAYSTVFILPSQNGSVSDEVNRFSIERLQDMFLNWNPDSGSTFVDIPQFELPSIDTHTLITKPFNPVNALALTIQHRPFSFKNLKRGTFNLSYGPTLEWAYGYPRRGATFEANRPFMFALYHRELRLILNIGTIIDPREGAQQP